MGGGICGWGSHLKPFEIVCYSCMEGLNFLDAPFLMSKTFLTPYILTDSPTRLFAISWKYTLSHLENDCDVTKPGPVMINLAIESRNSILNVSENTPVQQWRLPLED